MPAHYVYAAFWGGQEGTFLLWALITATLGLVLMRLRQPAHRAGDVLPEPAAGHAGAGDA